MTPQARQYYEEIFLKRYVEMQKQIESTPLAVLVWGPGEQQSGEYGQNLHQKRVDIVNALVQQGYAAVFSEDIENDAPQVVDSLAGRELAQAIVADFIVIIMGSAGSVAEAHDFAGYVRDIGSKMLIFVDAKESGGYSCRGALADLNTLYGNVSEFDYPADVTECHLLGAVQQRLGALRLVKWRMQLR